jgi:hypothetical protein
MRCYFHLVNSHKVIPDDTGIDVSDLEAMQLFAHQAIEDMRGEVIELGEAGGLSWSVPPVGCSCPFPWSRR